MSGATDSDPIRVAFVCVQNAGRSQMAHAFARRAIEARGLGDAIDCITGGTRPAGAVHAEVLEAMAAVGVDLGDAAPREVTLAELRDCDYVVTMGCAAEAVCPAGWGGETRDWDLPDPDGRPPDEVARIRDEIRRRVEDLVDELGAAV